MADRRPLDRPDAPHSDHDLLLMAAHAAGDVEADDIARADALLAACGECLTLVDDLRAIARATAELPAPVRPRDFFVRPADAARLRPNGLRRLAAAIAGPRIPLARPLAGGLMMLGFAGLLVAALPGVSQRASLAPADQRFDSYASPTPESDIQGLPGVAGSSPEPYSTDAYYVDTPAGGGKGASIPPGASGASGAESTPAVDPNAVRTDREAASAGPSVLVIGSLALVAIGAVLFAGSLFRTGPRRF